MRTPRIRRRASALVLALALVAAGCSGDDDTTSAPASTTTAPDGTDGTDATDGECSDEPVAVGDDGETVASLVEATMAEQGLTSVLYRVTRDGEVVASGGMGESMAGFPAIPSMHFRNGNVAFGYMGTLLLLMVEDGTVSLDDPVSRWLPDLDVPDADAVTLEMLVRNTSGYPDYVRDEVFQQRFLDDPFQQLTDQDLVDIAMTTPPWYPPGTAWSYAHTNYVILGQALAAAGGQPLEDLLTERVIEPMGLTQTAPALSPAVPEPVLHTYSTERDVLEDTTFWNPSWQTARGSVVTTTICDMATSAAATGSGSLLDASSYEILLDPLTSTLGPPPATCPDTVCRSMTAERYYGLGVIVWSGWVVQTPLFGGAGAVHAYLPEQDLAVALVAVQGATSEAGTNHAIPLWQSIATELAPEHVPIS